jgi:alkaline phosphatase D
LRRQELFLDFLNVNKDSPRRARRGVYASHDFGNAEQLVRVILLDTRSSRSDYPLAIIGAIGGGQWYGKMFPLIAASTRSLFGLTGLTKILEDRKITSGEILDDLQWRWLESQLSNSPAQINILVSSIQVLTKNPSVESWGHFPRERRRLFTLINKTKPKGFLIVSGDVHIAMPLTLSEKFPLLEATSSGLTHTCTAGGIPKFVCTLVWNLFEDPVRANSMILTKNYGKIDIDWKRKGFSVMLQSLTDNQSVVYNRSFDSLSDFDPDQIPGIIPEHSDIILILTMIVAFIMPAVLMKLVRFMLYITRK